MADALFPTSHEPVQLHTVAPVSKKNRGVILCPYSPQGRTRKLRGHVHLPSDEARMHEEQIAHDACHQVDAIDRPAFPTQDVRVTVVVSARTNTMAVEVEPIRERPKGFSGRRRDLHSHLDVLFDALERIVYQNDNQVAEIHVYRNTGETTTDEE